MKAFDKNGNGCIEENEFVELIDNAMRSGADTSQFKKISGALGVAKTKEKAPKALNTVTMGDMVKQEHKFTAE